MKEWINERESEWRDQTRSCSEHWACLPQPRRDDLTHFITTAVTMVKRWRPCVNNAHALPRKLADCVSEWRHLVLPTTACAGRYIKQHCCVSLRSTHTIISHRTINSKQRILITLILHAIDWLLQHAQTNQTIHVCASVTVQCQLFRCQKNAHFTAWMTNLNIHCTIYLNYRVCRKFWPTLKCQNLSKFCT